MQVTRKTLLFLCFYELFRLKSFKSISKVTNNSRIIAKFVAIFIEITAKMNY